ncbi:MAG TPA: tRNA (guanosine(37)-N1)-methyltransferase TrmD [Bdellovibrionales bacterium]|nr:tRNA (guanosine(37)-N1)-methyltransferase TrmD [Pseudobdellovibrionaceae bacterium]HAG91757.1 tRNA (guanosine(37)-N1)-methyltransferase TrmD [Bdellovibrionales bacterium]|tara:strand:+ start:2939 stop:3733 length:795 start_codon:yes stop_codon:yes gene_type:complete
MKFFVVTLFEEMFHAWAESGLVGQALKKQNFQMEFINPRSFTSDVHQAVDDKVYGGGDGMAAMFGPWSEAIEFAMQKEPSAQVIFLTPQGESWNQKKVSEFLQRKPSQEMGIRSFVFVCGRYAGFDERLVKAYADHEISIGDYVLNGGELAAMVVMESLVRGLPGVLGESSSFRKDSFGEEGLLECPQFTRPQSVKGMDVPSFLLSGHHKNIEALSRAISIVRTKNRRPELLEKAQISSKELEAAEKLIRQLSEEERDLLGVNS